MVSSGPLYTLLFPYFTSIYGRYLLCFTSPLLSVGRIDVYNVFVGKHPHHSHIYYLYVCYHWLNVNISIVFFFNVTSNAFQLAETICYVIKGILSMCSNSHTEMMSFLFVVFSGVFDLLCERRIETIDLCVCVCFCPSDFNIWNAQVQGFYLVSMSVKRNENPIIMIRALNQIFVPFIYSTTPTKFSGYITHNSHGNPKKKLSKKILCRKCLVCTINHIKSTQIRTRFYSRAILAVARTNHVRVGSVGSCSVSNRDFEDIRQKGRGTPNSLVQCERIRFYCKICVQRKWQ